MPSGAPQSLECVRLLALREETAKHHQSLGAAARKKAPPAELCELFDAFLAAEGRMLAGMEKKPCGLWGSCRGSDACAGQSRSGIEHWQAGM